MHSIVNKHSVKLWYVHIMFDMYGSLQGEMAAMLQKYNCDVIMHMRHICFFILQISPWTKFSQKENHSQKRVWGLHTWREYWDANTATPGGGAQEHSGENTGMIFIYSMYLWLDLCQVLLVLQFIHFCKLLPLLNNHINKMLDLQFLS